MRFSVFQIFILFFSAPWFFSESFNPQSFGLPVWAWWTIATAVFYATSIAWYLNTSWEKSEDLESEKPQEQ